MSEIDILQDFLKPYSKLPKQGSNEWLQWRSNSFGGSDLATLLQENKYKSRRTLIWEKITNTRDMEGAKNFFAWGHLFEPVHRLILMNMFEGFIYETGSIPWHISGCPYIDEEEMKNKNDAPIQYPKTKPC